MQNDPASALIILTIGVKLEREGTKPKWQQISWQIVCLHYRRTSASTNIIACMSLILTLSAALFAWKPLYGYRNFISELFWGWLWRNFNPKTWILNPRAWNCYYLAAFSVLKIGNNIITIIKFAILSIETSTPEHFFHPRTEISICSAVDKKLQHAPASTHYHGETLVPGIKLFDPWLLP